MNDFTDIRFEGPRNKIMQSIWAWVGVDEHGEEYIIGADLGMGPMPFVTSQESLIEKMRAFAESHSRDFVVKVKLVKFTERVDLEELSLVDKNASHTH